jgi:4'-phosphopantetheinyl transferase
MEANESTTAQRYRSGRRPSHHRKKFKQLKQGFSSLPYRADRLDADGGLAVWWLATGAAQPSDMQRWLRVLDPGERERASRFWIEADRREFAAAHALLRAMLTYYFDVPALAWRFLVDANGKPWVDPNVGPHEIQFNLSHTRGLVAVALASRGAIGVDVEEIDEAKADLAIAEAYFAPSEVELLRQAPPSERTRCFFRLWTLKEAYIKAIGEGLSAPLNSFAFTFEPIRVAFLHGARKGPANWRFAILPASDRHVLSIAADWLDCEAMGPATRALAPQDL